MIAIVTDSTVYMTEEEATLYGVRVIPMKYNVAGVYYSETFSDCNPHYVRHIFGKNADTCFTEQPSISAYLGVFKEFLAEGYDILCLTLSSKLSSAYRNACIAAKSLETDRISVVDSRLTGGGLYMLVRKARTFAIAGMSLQQISERLKELRAKICVRLSVDDLSYLRRGKRLSRHQSASVILNRKPILSLRDGALETDPAARDGFDQIKRLTDGITARTSGVIVHYVKMSKAVEEVVAYLRRKCPSTILELRPIGPVVGIHIGYAIIGLVWSEA